MYSSTSPDTVSTIPVTESPISFAVAGCGHIGKRHAEMITRDPGANLVGLCDVKARENLGIESYQATFFRNLEEMLEAIRDPRQQEQHSVGKI